MSQSHTCMCVYQVRSGMESRFEELLRTHWPTLHRLELVTDRPATLYRGQHDPDSPFFVEFMEWRNEEAPDLAHQLPEVVAIWEGMAAICEDRDGRPAMEFPEVSSLD